MENSFFIFWVPKRRVFLWRNYHIFVAKFYHVNFLKYYAIFNIQLIKWLGVKKFDPPLVKKTNFRQFSWKQVKFELQLPHSLLFIFSKNYFEVHKYLFNQRNIKSFARFNHYLGTVIPAVLTAFWNGHKKFKKKSKNWETFAMCHYMWPGSQEK